MSPENTFSRGIRSRFNNSSHIRFVFIPASSKVLVLSNTSRQATHSGNIVTLLSTDVENFDMVSLLPA